MSSRHELQKHSERCIYFHIFVLKYSYIHQKFIGVDVSVCFIYYVITRLFPEISDPIKYIIYTYTRSEYTVIYIYILGSDFSELLYLSGEIWHHTPHSHSSDKVNSLSRQIFFSISMLGRVIKFG